MAAVTCLTLCVFLSLSAAVNITETSSLLTFTNQKLSFDLVKTTGYIRNLLYENTPLLGNVSGLSGQVYSDWPSNGFSLTGNSSYELFTGSDWAGIVLTDNNTLTGGLVQRSWFLRDEESGIHSFLRLAYFNSSNPVQGPLGESRTMFRPNTDLWTQIVTNKEQWAPLPSAEAITNEVKVQDATWYLGGTPQDPYVISESDYWTKYTFADNQTNKAHGLYGTSESTSYGAWWVINQKDTFFGGPTHFDLMVDGIAYNKQSTSHGGASSPNITNGFDRTFGPQFLYFNSGEDSSVSALLADAEQYAEPSWNLEFYDQIAPHVVGYVPTTSRGTLTAQISVPSGASKVVAVLSANNLHFQDSALNPSSYQYWEDVQEGLVSIDRVKAGTYRLTVYADGIFGDFIQDDIVISAETVTSIQLDWIAESAGHELWRIGVPDKTSGEYRNGFERDLSHPNQPSKYRIYWGAWDFPDQFPDSVNYTVGQSDYSVDWNYVHWSQFGPTYTRNNTVTDINRWQINFDLEAAPATTSVATFTIQLAGATTTAGNTGIPQGAYPSFAISTYVNDESDPLNFEIEYYQSGSCAVRSGISCYLLTQKFEFPGIWLKEGHNQLVLELPFAAAGIYVQYDALRLELSEV